MSAAAAAAHLAARRRMLAQLGRPMTLRRQLTVNPATFQDVALSGVLRAYSPRELTGGLVQGDAQVSTLADEITAAGWPGPPKPGDVIIAEGVTWSVRGSQAAYAGDSALGFTLWVRGGR